MVHSRTLTALPTGTSLSRYTRALLLSQKQHRPPAEIAEDWIDSPGVAMALKAAVTSMDSSTALTRYGIADEFLEIFRGFSIVGQLQSKMRSAPFTLAIPTETASATAYWIPEDAPIPVSKLTLSSVALLPAKIGAIIPFTEELARSSKPSAERVIRDALVTAVASKVDSAFLSSAAAVAGSNPAGILLGAGTVTSTGSTESSIKDNLATMISLLASWRTPTWIMRTATFATISARIGPAIQPAGALSLLGIPVVLSASSPSQIVLTDLSDVVLVDENRLEISLSREAAIEMSDVPIVGESSPFTSAVLKSAFQNNLIFIKVLRWISWAIGHSTSAVSMQTSY